jgi:sec-independent protein translocase protein TatB
MFDSIGWGEIAVLALAALFIFGPDRLPTLAKEAASALRRIRSTIIELRGQVDDSLGEEFAGLRDVNLTHYRPTNLLREHLLGDDDVLPTNRKH